VLRGELPAHFHPQAQRALAVAARSYVLYEKLTAPAGRDYDVLADERSQMYIGVKGEDATAVGAVDDTLGEVCLVRDGGSEKVFSTYYSSSCGGMTQPVLEFRPGDPNVPSLAGNVVCNDCYLAPSFQWNPVRMSKAEITRRVVARYPRLSRLGQITQVTVEDRGKSGRATKIKLVGSGGASEILVAEDFRLCLGGHTLKSTRFKIVDEGSKVRFVDGRGFGHGVGLCQYGADRQAKLGRSYRQILEYYYPGVIIRSVY
jgi:stage II sporulation protein D